VQRRGTVMKGGGAELTKEELERALEPYPIEENFKVVLQEPLGLSVAEFWKQFYEDGAPYSHEKFFIENGESDVKEQPWQPKQEGE